MHKGSCLCGAVNFEVVGSLVPPGACHCSQCRKQSGHVWASTDVKRDNLHLSNADNVTWYPSSPGVRRGFCRRCGSILFWDQAARDIIEISMGAFDTPTDTRLAYHIFVGEKGDYYDITDGLPQNLADADVIRTSAHHKS